MPGSFSQSFKESMLTAAVRGSDAMQLAATSTAVASNLFPENSTFPAMNADGSPTQEPANIFQGFKVGVRPMVFPRFPAFPSMSEDTASSVASSQSFRAGIAAMDTRTPEDSSIGSGNVPPQTSATIFQGFKANITHGKPPATIFHGFTDGIASDSRKPAGGFTSANANSPAMLVSALRGLAATTTSKVNALAANATSGNNGRLISAVSCGDIAAVMKLLDEGANVNAVDLKGNSALIIAVLCHHAEVVSALIDHGADVNAQGEYNTTALQQAVIQGDADTVASLISRGANIHAVDAGGNCALHHAAARSASLVCILVDAGSDVNAVNCCGETPLMRAAARGHLDTVSYFLGKGADGNAVSKEGKSAIVFAAASMDGDTLVPLLVEAGVRDSSAHAVDALVAAVSRGNIPCVKGLLAAGASVNASASEKNALTRRRKCSANEVAIPSERVSALGAVNALQPQSTELVCILLQAGADDRTGKGADVLTEEIRRIHWENVATLIQAGVSVNAGKDGAQCSNALCCAVQTRNVPLVQLVLEAGALVNVMDASGVLPLHLAASSKNGTGMLSTLLQAGSSIDSMDRTGNTALTCAISQRWMQNAKFLIEAGASVNMSNYNGETALHKAVTLPKNSYDMSSRLLAAGADVNAADRDGRTALDHKVSNRGSEHEDATLLRMVAAGASLKYHAGRDPFGFLFHT
jgi:ankyrin repeat protein